MFNIIHTSASPLLHIQALPSQYLTGKAHYNK